MRTRELCKRLRDGAVVTTTILGLLGAQGGSAFAESGDRHGDRDGGARTPIKHVIIIIGENRSFDHVYATYKPRNANETVSNLLSKGIVKADGTPGVNYAKAVQKQASDFVTFELAPSGPAYATLPPAVAGGPGTPYGCQEIGVTTGANCDSPANEAAVLKVENGLDDEYVKYLLTGGLGAIVAHKPDPRVSYNGHDASHLPSGPFQITSATHPYDAYDASPVHRLFQMWQQLDCDASHVTEDNPSGCLADLFPWVETTVGAGSNGKAQPANFTNLTTGEGSTSMGFYNVQNGDAPYLKALADSYTMSDNYHQAALGGTGANHIMLGAGDAMPFTDGQGNLATPPHNPVNPQAPGAPPNGTSALSEIEDPTPQPGTNNYYTQDGYGGGGSPTATAPKASYGGGSYVGCADRQQPGVAAVQDYLTSLKPQIKPNCDAGAFYLVNNYNPGYFGDGSNAYTDTNANNYVFTIPPSTLRNIGDELNDKRISWAYFGDQWNIYKNDKYQSNPRDVYCNICNWAQYSTSIMTNPSARAEHLRDTTDLYAGIKSGELPAVSYVKPSGLVDGHPASSKLNLFEGYVAKIVEGVKANPKLWDDTAIFVTFDEGGGYWDSGYVQPLDFFGDGTRIPMIVVSKYSIGGHISHEYTDHASTLKFIEANWGLSPLTHRSRDNYPNPIVKSDNPYVPTNSPAIGDMMDMFKFSKH
ncbi:MAG: phosphoesterase [Pseudomonadota bacterium]|nr:phosphoesterase [Pseudomonadota bacterium]